MKGNVTKKIRDGSVTTEKLSADIQTLIGAAGSAENHRNILRCKNLGTEVTDAQKEAIRNGTFDDLFLGDYWEIGGVVWRIVDMDYWYNTGAPALTKHHLVIMPDSCLYNCLMNNTNTSKGGYVGSKMYTEGLSDAGLAVESVFGSMVLAHKECLSNAVTDGVVTGVAFVNSDVELPSEIMMYGTNIFSPINDGTRTFIGFAFSKTQLALFDVAPRFITNGETYWLRDVVSPDSFAFVNSSGTASFSVTHSSCGVRPVFGIC